MTALCRASGTLVVALLLACNGGDGESEGATATEGTTATTEDTSTSAGSTDATTNATNTTTDATTDATTSMGSTSMGSTSMSSTGETSTTGDPSCDVQVAIDGDDHDGCGAVGDPCRTVTRGLATVTPGCAVHVGPGTFDSAGGELFPLIVGDNITLIGAGDDPSDAPTILDHQAGPPLPTTNYPCPVGQASDHSAPLVLRGVGAIVRDLIVLAPKGQNAEVGVLIEGGDATIERVRVEGGAEGIFIAGDGTIALLHAITVTEAGHAAVKPAGTSIVDVEEGVFFANKDAVEPICDATTTIRASEAYCNGNGLEALANADTTLYDNHVHHNNVGIAGRGDEISLFMRGNLVEDNLFGAIDWFGAADLGAADDPGGNTFSNNAVAGFLLIRAPADVPAIGNTWQADVDGADAQGKYVGDVTYGPPRCPAQGLQGLDVPPPPQCTGREPVVPLMGYRNVAIEDGSCAGAMTSPTGDVILSVP